MNQGWSSRTGLRSALSARGVAVGVRDAGGVLPEETKADRRLFSSRIFSRYRWPTLTCLSRAG
jgi:hypothetical protein